MNNYATICVYLLIFTTTTLLAHCYQSGRRIVCYKRTYNLAFSFIIHWVFLAFSNVGSDYSSYYAIIDNMRWNWAISSTETIFNVLCYILKLICDNADIVIFIIKTITLLIFYAGFHMIKDEVNLGYAMFAFNSLIYLQSFYLLQMTLSISIIFISMLLLNKEKRIFAFALLIIASLIHTSSFILLPFYILYIIFDFRKRKMSLFQIVITVVLFIIIMFGYMHIYVYAIGNISIFEQYAQYRSVSVATGTGLTNYIISAYLVYIAYMCMKNFDDYHVDKAILVFTMASILVLFMGYRFAILSRMNKSFIYLYIYVIPAYLRYRKTNRSGNYIISTYQSEWLISIIFILFIWFFNFSDYVGVESVTQMQNYSMFMPFL